MELAKQEFYSNLVENEPQEKSVEKEEENNEDAEENEEQEPEEKLEFDEQQWIENWTE